MRSRRGLAVALGAVTALAVNPAPADLSAFAGWGSALLHGHPSAVYADRSDQGGPLQLLVNVLVRLVAPSGNVWLPVVAVVNGGLVYLVMRWCAAVHPDAADEAQLAQRELLAAAVVILWLAQGSLWSGHPAEVLTAGLWFAGMVFARRGRHVLAGALFGASMGIAPWALLGAPAVLAVTRLRGAVIVAAVAGMVGPALYLPFALTGHFHLLDFRWQVEPHSLVSLLMPVGASFGWPQRLVQAVVVAGGTAGVALWLRRRPDLALVLAPMVATALRVASDPRRFDYYWLPIEVLSAMAVVLAPLATTRLGIARRTLLLCYVAWAAVAVSQGWLGALLVVVLIAAHAARPTFTASGRARAASAATCTAAPSPATTAPGTCP